MANFPKMRLTNAGLNLLSNVQAGADKLTFTKMVLGDGEISTPIASLTAIVNPKIECEVTTGKSTGTGTYQIGAFFSNASITTGFWWRELGVYAKGNDGNEILYCYTNAGDAGDYIPIGGDERVEKYIYNSLAIGNAENITVEINGNDTFIATTEKGAAGGVAPLNDEGKIDDKYLPEMDYAGSVEFKTLSDNFTSHKNASNPHNIKPSTIGLGNVPNVSTNDQTPTYTQASTLSELVSGEKLSIVLGKVKKAIYDFIAHLSDTTKHITSTERTTWNNNTQSTSWKPLKELAISITGVNWGVSAKIFPVLISGVDFDSYEDYKISFTGKFDFPATTSSGYRYIYLCLDSNGVNANTSTYKVMATARSIGSNAFTITFNENEVCTFLKNSSYKNISNVENSQSISQNKLYKIDSETFVRNLADGTNVYFNLLTNNNTASVGADGTLTGTLKIYGRGAI